MSDHVFVVSEWLPKKNQEQELWKLFKNLLAHTLEHEKGCLRAHLTKQISHPGSPGKSKYTIVLLQEYINIQAFDAHCAADYVTDFLKNILITKKPLSLKSGAAGFLAKEMKTFQNFNP